MFKVGDRVRNINTGTVGTVSNSWVQVGSRSGVESGVEVRLPGFSWPSIFREEVLEKISEDDTLTSAIRHFADEAHKIYENRTEGDFTWEGLLFEFYRKIKDQ